MVPITDEHVEVNFVLIDEKYQVFPVNFALLCLSRG